MSNVCSVLSNRQRKRGIQTKSDSGLKGKVLRNQVETKKALWANGLLP